MFISDRGSCIKEHDKYGGKWLEKLRGKRRMACITNEHLMSQPCLYCFKWLEHPLRIIRLKQKGVAGIFLCVKTISVKYGSTPPNKECFLLFP